MSQQVVALNVWSSRPISDCLVKAAPVNAPKVSDVSFERIAKAAADARESLARLDRLIEGARVRAMKGDVGAHGVLLSVVDEVYSVLCESQKDLDQ